MNFQEKLALAVEFNKRVVAWQKVGQIATADLIRQDNISEKDLSELVYIYPKWQAGIAVLAGDLYRHNDTLFEAIQSHTSQADWAPDTAPALWKSKAPSAVIPNWVQPTGAHDAYQKGDIVSHNGKLWVNDIDANTYEPGVYGWSIKP